VTFLNTQEIDDDDTLNTMHEFFDPDNTDETNFVITFKKLFCRVLY